MKMNVFILEILRTDNCTFFVYESIPIITHMDIEDLYLDILEKHDKGEAFVFGTNNSETVYHTDSFEVYTFDNWKTHKSIVHPV